MAKKIDTSKVSPEEFERAMELLEKDKIRKEKIKRGEIKGGLKWSEMSEEQKDKARLAARKRNAKIKLLCEKATAAGITVSDEEVEAAMAS